MLPIIFPIALNPHRFPSMGGPSFFPVPRYPDPITIIVRRIVNIWGIIFSMINRRAYPNNRWIKKYSKVVMVMMRRMLMPG